MATRSAPSAAGVVRAVDARLLRVAGGPFGPTRLAVVFAVISIPAVAFGVPAYVPAPTGSGVARLSPADPVVWIAAIPAVLAAAVVAGSIGGWVLRRRLSGFFLTLLLAWVVAIVVIPVGPNVLHLPYGTACFNVLADCGAGVGFSEITTPEGALQVLAANGLTGLAASVIYAFIPFVALVIGILVWARAVLDTRPEGSMRSDDET